MPLLNEWDSFYVIVGSSAGALIGLQFIVMTLVAEKSTSRGTQAGAAFATPTIVHFSTVLLLSALLRAPWQGITLPAVLCGFIGFSGIAYGGITARRMRTQTTYRPEFEDWLCHFILPFAAYAIIAASAYAVLSCEREALFGFGGATLMLLFIGIHNTWDALTYHVFVKAAEKND